MDAQLTRLEEARDDLARRFLARVVERSSLDEIAGLPTARLARELPGVVVDVVRAAEGGAAGDREASERCAARLLALRGRPSPDAGEVATDAAVLGSVMTEALAEEVVDPGARTVLASADRLSRALGDVVRTAIAEAGATGARDAEARGGADAVTGLPGREQIRRHLDQAVAIHQRYGRPFALALVDVEGLRRINESRGREAGDRVLAAVASAVRSTVRAADAAGRIGDDELCVIAPEQTSAGAVVMSERIVRAVDAIDDPEGVAARVTVGVVACPEHGSGADRLLELADEASFGAKASGERVAAAAAPLASAAGGGDG